MRWRRVQLIAKSPGRRTSAPGKRWGHTCNSIKNGRHLYVFGGYGKDNSQTNEVHVFDTGKQAWTKPMLKGTPPSPRDSHSCTTVGTNLFVFGGTDGKSQLGDLYVLDTITNTWSKPHLEGEGPDPREGHSAALIGTNLYIFGGCGRTADDSEECYFNDLYILDTVRMAWIKAVTQGLPPTPRDSHTCCSWSNKLVVVGGEDASDSYLSDVHLLDTDTMEWRELQGTGQMLMPRAGHAMVPLAKLVFVFGGFADERRLFDDLHMLDIESGTWTKVTTVGDRPSARFSVAGDCIDARTGLLVFFGGCNENLEALDDMYYLETEMQVEKGQDEKLEKFSVRKELKRKRQENQLVAKSPIVETDSDSQLVTIKSTVTEELIRPTIEQKPRFTTNIEPPCPAVGDKFSLFERKPVEEKVFQAKITDVFHYGYTIESNIEGKLLRGLLFSYKPGFAHAVHAYFSRKKLSSESTAENTRKKMTRGPRNTVRDGDIVPSNATIVEAYDSVHKQAAAVQTQFHADIPVELHQVKRQVQAVPVAHHQYQQMSPSLQNQFQSGSQPMHPRVPICSSIGGSSQPSPAVSISSPTGVGSQAHPQQFISAGYVGLTHTLHEASSGQSCLYGIRNLHSSSQGRQFPQHQTFQTDEA